MPADSPADTVYDRFAAFAAAAPAAPAAYGNGRMLTYGEIDAAAAAVAAALAAHGVAPGDRVGVLVERSTDLLVGLLGAWRAGAVYLPLDTDHPVDRTGMLLADAGAVAVVTRGDRRDRGGLMTVDLDRPARGATVDRRPTSGDAAYVIYTSGSTGRPKAVEVEHRCLANVVCALADILRAGPGEHWLTMAPPTFDISLAELCLPLATGARVTISSAAQSRDAARLVRLIGESGITRMQAVPSQWQALLDAGLRAPHLIAMTGGETLPTGLANALTERLGGLVNGYGPTETAIVSTVWPVPAGARSVRIGRPIAGTRVYVLDESLGETVIGELYIGGIGVARGYVGDPELTAAAFVDDPRAPGERMYRTGDRVRMHPDGNLEYLGRTDGQVKIRGQRVELGEVEAGIATFAAVRAAVAVVRDQDLVAYVVPADPAAPPTPAQVREHAARTLTSAMAPTSVVVLESFPLTANGKIDRDALRLPATPAGRAPTPGDDPFTAEFCTLIQDVLGADRVGPADDFFDVGGHSLAVMRMVAAIAERWQVQVASDVFYDTETVADLASAVHRLRVAA